MKHLIVIVLSLIILYLSKISYAKELEGDYVVVMHGIASSSKQMKNLAIYLKKEGYDVINVSYPSTNNKLEKLVDLVNKKLSVKFIKDKPIHFVGYSLGGLLIRAMIQKYPPKKLGRVVQIGTPNNGSEIIDFIKDKLFYKKILGPLGNELSINSNILKKLLGKVNYEIGGIAGNISNNRIASVIIPGDDDGVVSIKSTKFEGIKDHIVVSSSHINLPTNKIVHKQTLYFLKNGVFNHSK
jgi:esterase/lipase